MTEYIDGLYITGDSKDLNADILYNEQISSGYSDGKGFPRPQKAIEIFYEQSFKYPWFESTDFDEFFTNPKLIAPINLIKWKD